MTKEPIFDDDNPEWTDEDFARSTRVEDLPAEDRDAIVAAFPKTAKRLGRPVGSVKADKKAQVTLRLDPDVLEHFRATGAGWQSRINETLRGALPKR